MRCVLAMLLLLNLGCSSSPTEPGSGSSTATLRFGQTTKLLGKSVSFTDVADSRCPQNVACVWAGDAAIHLTSGSEELVLHTSVSAGSVSGKLAGITLTLVDVKPERITTGPVDKTVYVVTLRASK